MPPLRISIVVPAYNAAKTVAATLESLLAQTVAPAEIVVVDDGSKDLTREALRPYAERTKLVFQPNSGVSAARNRGVAETTGDWVAFCDADDLWHPQKLEVITAAIAAVAAADLVFHDFWTIENGEMIEARATHSAQTMFPIFKELDLSIPRMLSEYHRIRTTASAFPEVSGWHGPALRWLMLGNFLMPSTVAVRKAVFLAAGAFDAEFRYAEDTEFFLRYAKRTSFLWLDAPLAGYRRAAGTLLTGNMKPTILNGTRAVVKHCIDDADVLPEDRRWVRRAVARRLSRLAYYCLSELDLGEARHHATSALRYDLGNRRAWAVAAMSFVPIVLLRAARTLKSRGR